MNENFSNRLALWHQFVEKPDSKILDELLHQEVKFHSPFVWKPKEGKEITGKILMTVTAVFTNFRYIREIIEERNWALEFEAEIGELSLRGVDLIQLDETGKIIDFEVMIRPANALQILGLEMGKRLANG